MAAIWSYNEFTGGRISNKRLNKRYRGHRCNAGVDKENSKSVTLRIRRIIMQKHLTAIIEREGNGYVSLCPELDIASQGDTIEEAHRNLQEALELFFETASPAEIKTRLHEEIYVTQAEVAVG
jgi:predicted RNase H-like HicB family nuclease